MANTLNASLRYVNLCCVATKALEHAPYSSISLLLSRRHSRDTSTVGSWSVAGWETGFTTRLRNFTTNDSRAWWFNRTHVPLQAWLPNRWPGSLCGSILSLPYTRNVLIWIILWRTRYLISLHQDAVVWKPEVFLFFQQHSTPSFIARYINTPDDQCGESIQTELCLSVVC